MEIMIYLIDYQLYNHVKIRPLMDGNINIRKYKEYNVNVKIRPLMDGNVSTS